MRENKCLTSRAPYKGENPADLPVQEVTRPAKVLGLTIQETLLATADEVIQ
jgi:hypothetical protein